MCQVDMLWNDFFEARKEFEPVPEPEPKRLVATYICKFCSGSKIFNSDNLLTCSECGIVDEQYLLDDPEWMSCVTEDGQVNNNARCELPVDTLLFSEKWGAGTNISKSRSKEMNKLSTINFHMSMHHKDRALFHAYKHIESAAKDVLNLPDSVIRSAKVTYRKFNEDKLTRGAVRTGIKANCVIYACKDAGVPRTTLEVANAFGIPTKDISRTAELFKDIFEPRGVSESKSEITRPSDMVPRLLNNFHLEDKRPYTVKCMKLCSKLEKCVTLMGKTPVSVATTIISFVLSEMFSRNEVAAKCSVSVPTMNKIDTIIKSYLEGKIP